MSKMMFEGSGPVHPWQANSVGIPPGPLPAIVPRTIENLAVPDTRVEKNLQGHPVHDGAVHAARCALIMQSRPPGPEFTGQFRM